MDYTFVQITSVNTSDTWSAGDIAMDDIKVLSSDDYNKSFEAGFPSINYTSFETDIRCRVSPSEANGYSIGEFGIFNTDGTPLLKSRDTFTTISKTNTDEVVFVAKTRLN